VHLKSICFRISALVITDIQVFFLIDSAVRIVFHNLSPTDFLFMKLIMIYGLKKCRIIFNHLIRSIRSLLKFIDSIKMLKMVFLSIEAA